MNIRKGPALAELHVPCVWQRFNFASKETALLLCDFDGQNRTVRHTFIQKGKYIHAFIFRIIRGCSSNFVLFSVAWIRENWYLAQFYLHFFRDDHSYFLDTTGFTYLKLPLFQCPILFHHKHLPLNGICLYNWQSKRKKRLICHWDVSAIRTLQSWSCHTVKKVHNYTCIGACMSFPGVDTRFWVAEALASSAEIHVPVNHVNYASEKFMTIMLIITWELSYNLPNRHFKPFWSFSFTRSGP